MTLGQWPKEDAMKLLFRLVLVSGVALAGAALPAMAQQGEQPKPMMGNTDQAEPGQGMQGMMDHGTADHCDKAGGMRHSGMQGMQGMMGGRMMSDFGPRMEGRLAYLKAELGITEAQTTAWEAYAIAVRARGTTMQSMHAAMMQTMQTGNVMDRMDAHIKAMESMVESLKAQKPATEALYAVLDDAQKKKADYLLGGGHGMM
jgi:hypothetical protein